MGGCGGGNMCGVRECVCVLGKRRGGSMMKRSGDHGWGMGVGLGGGQREVGD